MNENNAVTKDELKEILAEMVKELRAETVARFEEMEKRNATRFEEMEKKTDNRHAELLGMMRTQSDMIWAQNKKIDDQYRYFQESHSKLLTGMDAMVKEQEIIRHEQLSLGAIQDRHTREIADIKQQLGAAGKNGKRPTNFKKGKTLMPKIKKSK
jgi:hypothetical protein